jgi:phosphoribosylamine---glycine ligase
MKILVIGSGGREHALVWKLAQSPHVTRVWGAPGNGGIADEHLVSNSSLAQCIPVPAEDLKGLLAFAREHRPDLTIVGPDNPLAMGIVDLFQANGFRIWGPNQSAARFESSKAFSQAFMERHGIPTARSGVFSAPGPARDFVRILNGRCVVKADGLALGKGVLMARNPAEADRAIDTILVDRAFGGAGAQIVIQEYLEGTELSLHALCDGAHAVLFPTSQDHKRAYDGDEGPNTGGMGTYSPAPFLSEVELQGAYRAIVEPWLAGCRAEGIEFKGILYPGLMLTSSGPKVLEFNARFGDPETQVYVTRLDSDLVELLEASLNGTLDRLRPLWSSQHAVCVVMASGGYPGDYRKGLPIAGLDEAARLPNTKVFHAGTKRTDDALVTSGGRVLGVTAWAPTLRQARDNAYRAVELIRFENVHFRRDIAAKAL